MFTRSLLREPIVVYSLTILYTKSNQGSDSILEYFLELYICRRLLYPSGVYRSGTVVWAADML